ncbi:MAG: hypothetical protein JNJ85_09890 [Candidatus Kapabacteria bacterium]|nr:hypothetical protein [Candidatus Kapabacteria bacterium]
MKYFIVSLALSLLFLNACKDDPVTQTTTIPDNASTFLFNGTVGTVYSYRTSSVTVDTNGFENRNQDDTITYTIDKSISTDTNGRKYVKMFSSKSNGFFILISDDSTFGLGAINESEMIPYLKKPFQENATFNSTYPLTGVLTNVLFDVNKAYVVPAGTFNVIGCKSTNTNTKNGKTESVTMFNWFGEGNGFIEYKADIIVEYPSGKKETSHYTMTLINIIKP